MPSLIRKPSISFLTFLKRAMRFFLVLHVIFLFSFLFLILMLIFYGAHAIIYTGVSPQGQNNGETSVNTRGSPIKGTELSVPLFFYFANVSVAVETRKNVFLSYRTLLPMYMGLGSPFLGGVNWSLDVPVNHSRDFVTGENIRILFHLNERSLASIFSA